MIKNLLNADEQPPEGTKVIIEDTVVNPPTIRNESSLPGENAPDLETRPAFELPQDANFSTAPADASAAGSSLDADKESLDALMAEIENLEPEELDRLERELETAGLNEPSSALRGAPFDLPAAPEQLPAARIEAEKTPVVPVDPAAEKSAFDTSEPTIFQSNYTPLTTAETVRNSGLAWSAGVVLFGSVVFMMIFGWFADLLLGSSPWGILVGIILGALIGFIQFFRITSQIFRK
jgi:hypothetical protein